MLNLGESVEGNQTFPLLHDFVSAACTKPFTTECMDVSRLWELNEKKVEVALSSGFWSPRSEGWPR